MMRRGAAFKRETSSAVLCRKAAPRVRMMELCVSKATYDFNLRIYSRRHFSLPHFPQNPIRPHKIR